MERGKGREGIFQGGTVLGEVTGKYGDLRGGKEGKGL